MRHVGKYIWVNGLERGVALEHVLVAENALGRKLPKGAEVHHIDENRHNNSPNNLVVCPSSAYHKLLHIRKRALEETGHVDWRKCRYCKEWSDPKTLVKSKNGDRVLFEHKYCQLEHQRRCREKRRAA